MTRAGGAILIKLKRAYEDPSPSDGYRVLVDRLWPRGRTKTQLALDEWLKDVAPSNLLRRQFGHDPLRWDRFKIQYEKELRSSAAAQDILRRLARMARRRTVTLVYGARDERHNQAVALRGLIERL